MLAKGCNIICKTQINYTPKAIEHALLILLFYVIFEATLLIIFEVFSVCQNILFIN